MMRSVERESGLDGFPNSLSVFLFFYVRTSRSPFFVRLMKSRWMVRDGPRQNFF
ncbi:MAG: hypothetical protein HYY55_02085 [Candidatus Niyogibacteria bacterium]|nr:MAG: hypothetical protein HYY55_02085 [Candidatus Niyogibacteria bacterium]